VSTAPRLDPCSTRRSHAYTVTIGGTTAGAGNVISGNKGDGIFTSAPNAVFQGNLIGTDATGLAALGNAGAGIDFSMGFGNTVGGTTPAARNVISANGRDGIEIFIRNNTILGNYIGTDITGQTALGNTGAGILINGSFVIPNVDGNVIGGTAPGAGNLISGNTGAGVSFRSVNGCLIAGNQIGTDVTGTAALGNQTGVLIVGFGNTSFSNTIGGTTAAAGNLISGNHGNGIEFDPGANGNRIQGNRIGTDVSGMQALGNGGDGVALVGGAHDDTVGGTASGAGNIIAFNGGDGVLVDGGTSNAIQHNSIFANANLGIELINGGNNNQPAPVLTSAVAGGGSTVVQGSFTGRASTTYTIEVFADTNNPAQGKQFLGSVTVTTGSDGTANLMVSFAVELSLGQWVTATATDPGNNTSAFSGAVAVSG
jgi:hypothetical protein